MTQTTHLCSRCHTREATRVLMSGARKTYFCDVCEPTTLADFRRLVRLDDPIFAKPAPRAITRDPRDVTRIAELEQELATTGRTAKVSEERRAALERQLAAGAGVRDRRIAELERQLADGARAFERIEQEHATTCAKGQAVIDETCRQLRAAEFSSAQWEDKAAEYKSERDTALEKLGKAAAARDEAHAEVAQLRKQIQATTRIFAPPAPVVPPQIADAPSRRRLTDLVASTIPLRGVRPLLVPPEMDLVFSVLPADNRSKVAQAIRDYLCGRRAPTKARGLDDTGRQLFTLGAGKFALTLALDELDGFRIHDLALATPAGAR